MSMLPQTFFMLANFGLGTSACTSLPIILFVTASLLTAVNLSPGAYVTA